MIPKIVHICWLSGDPFPADIQKCLDTWKLYLSDYEIWLWGKKPINSESTMGAKVIEKEFDINSTLWTRQAFEQHKYAFAADYIRMYALYCYGGIYLDSDVIMYKSFDELLHLPYFIGQEQMGSIEPAIIGAEKGCYWIADILAYYTNRQFVFNDGTLDSRPLPYVCYDVLCEKYKFVRLHKLYNYDIDGSYIYIHNKDFFNSRNRIEPIKTDKSFCSHAYAGSWMKPKTGTKAKIRKMIPKCFLKLYLDVSHTLWNRAAEHLAEPEFYKEIE